MKQPWREALCLYEKLIAFPHGNVEVKNESGDKPALCIRFKGILLNNVRFTVLLLSRYE